jgi:hypothetical protein
MAFAVLLSMLAVFSFAAEYHVSESGVDTNPGTSSQPFGTIQKAADVMQPGDACVVHAGTYREEVIPPRGGTSESQRITYRAQTPGTVFWKGSNQFTNWTVHSGNTYRVSIPNTSFGSFNPYTVYVDEDWMTYGAGQYHRGQVFFEGGQYRERSSLSNVTATSGTWYVEQSGGNTVIYANFGGANPNTGLAEVTMRKSVFRPVLDNGVHYITLSGFVMSHGAPNWSPPVPSSTDQEGLVTTRRGRGWIIEGNTITDSKTVGICSGTIAGTETKDYSRFGYHIVRNNIIQRCGEAGICGNTGWNVSVIEGNLIEEINPFMEFGGYETACIKIHNSIDFTIRNNVLRGVHRPASVDGNSFHNGIWIDWGNQNIRITGNIIYDTDQMPVHFEKNVGGHLVDNNVIVGNDSPYGGLRESGAHQVHYVHNLIVNCDNTYQVDSRTAPYYQPHSTTRIGTWTMDNGSGRYCNNIYVEEGLNTHWNNIGNVADYNVHYAGAQKAGYEGNNSRVLSSFDPQVVITSLPDGAEVTYSVDASFPGMNPPVMTASYLGVNSRTGMVMEEPDGTPIDVNTDMLGTPRSSNPTPGPFEDHTSGTKTYQLIVGPGYDPTHQDPTGLSISGFTASPNTTAAVTVDFSVTATDDGSITSVVLDLSQLGGSAQTAMAAGANDTYAASITVPAAFPLGEKQIVVTVTDNDGNVKTRSTTVRVAGETGYTIIYSDAEDHVSWTWAGDGGSSTTTCTEVTSTASEGTQSYDLSYSMGGWWAGGGLGFDPIDLSGQDSLIFSYQGPGNGLQILVNLAFSDGTETDSYQLSSTSSFTRVAIPLSYFSGAYDWTSVVQLNMIVTGVESGASGHFYIDDVKLAGSGGHPTALSQRPASHRAGCLSVSCQGRTLTMTGTAARSLQVIDMKGALVGRIEPDRNGVSSLVLPAGGVYLVTTRENGRTLAYRVVAR